MWALKGLYFIFAVLEFVTILPLYEISSIRICLVTCPGPCMGILSIANIAFNSRSIVSLLNLSLDCSCFCITWLQSLLLWFSVRLLILFILFSMFFCFNTWLYSVLYCFSLLQFWLLQLHLYVTLFISYSPLCLHFNAWAM